MPARSPPRSRKEGWPPTALADLDDEAAVATIAAVRGLGRWTAEVYLLFALGRARTCSPPAISRWPPAAAHLKGLPRRPAPAGLRAVAEAWRPSRAGRAAAVAPLAACDRARRAR